MFKKINHIMRNKYLLIALLILNALLFIAGILLVNTDLMILAALSFAAVLLSIEINSYGDRDES